jgi:hypothetical protein
MSTTITSHLDAIRILSLTTPSITAPIETLVKTVQAQANDLAEGLDRAHSDRDEARSESKTALKAQFKAETERDQALRELATAKTEIAKTSTVALLRELAGSPAKLLLVLREAGYTVGVRDLASGTPALAEDEIAILSDPAQHGPSLIAVLVKV